ncbi:hypothetical protein ABPG75_001939 [Micractinium tetrahymenae]
MSEAGAPSAAADAAAPLCTAADPPAAAADPEASKARKNRVKKLKAQYLSILELEAHAAAGQALDAGQAAKVARKSQVAEEITSLGAELPEPPPAASLAGAAGSFEDLSPAEVEAAMEAAMGGGPRRRPSGPTSRALAHQLKLQEANPGYCYFFVLPEPLPDVGVVLQDTMGALFFETMRPRAEAGEPRAVKMMYQQLLPSAEQAGLPAMQVRLQLLAEYGVDPVTEAVVPGSEEDKLAWLMGVVPPAERKAAERQLEQAALRMMVGSGAGGGRGGRQRRRR